MLHYSPFSCVEFRLAACSVSSKYDNNGTEYIRLITLSHAVIVLKSEE